MRQTFNNRTPWFKIKTPSPRRREVNEQFLNMMRQWLDQLEQGQDHNAPEEAQSSFDTQTSSAHSDNPSHADLLYRLTRQSTQFCRFADELLSLHDDTGSVDSTQLLNTFRRHLDRLNQDWVMHSWTLPEQLGILLTLMTRETPQPASDLLTKLLQQLLNTLEPHTQPSRLAQLRRTLHQLEHFEQARECYLQQLTAINQTALEHLNQHLVKHPIDNLDALHQQWVDCYEQAYQQQLEQPEYLQAFGNLGNAAMALRHGWQQQLEQLYSACGWVTQTQYDALSQQHHELRRRVRVLERQMQQQATADTPPTRDMHDTD
ncbi:poly(R)-hydroxyalkanoic acid synthase subunit PhaE [Marinobacterium halophilum]|uniref:poly(R)-hydroxyalkanoic acid synthase subunit PhaE n=1 Tax=Marinobacterium halophilum TaxID=267374 RepID=UPI00147546B3|nr:poly(R)-hydroxyalkanoic acid synthase subunit PhaE [Marinobacterium halophilum]